MPASGYMTSVAVLLSTISTEAADPVPPLYEGDLIFPLEKWHNHSSCIVEAPDGSLLACWFHGSGERRADDVRIEGARRRRGQGGWSPRFEMADTPNYPDCNPTMYVDSKQRLWLIWPTILENSWESALLKYRLSANWYGMDGAPRWDWQDVLHITPTNLDTDIEEAFKQLPDFLRNNLSGKFAEARKRLAQKLYHRLGWMPRVHPTRLADGKWILPLYCDTFSVSLMAITADDGRTWQFSRSLVGWGNIQPSVIQRSDGSLVAMMRENGITQRIRAASSTDGGMTWSPVRSMSIPNPGSSLEVTRLKNNHWALVYNDTERGRHSLAVSISDDEGKTWKWTRHLERVEREKGGFAYPSVIQASDGSLHATYSYHLSTGGAIKHVHFNEAWVQQGDPVPTSR